MKTAIPLPTPLWKAGGSRGPSSGLPVSVLPVLLGGKHISPPPDAGEEEWAVCLTAKTEVQLSGIILLKIQDKITANSLNCFLVRPFKIEVHFFGQKCNYCSHHIRI